MKESSDNGCWIQGIVIICKMDDVREMYTGARNKEEAVSIINDITATGTTQQEVNVKYDKWAATYNEVILTLHLLICLIWILTDLKFCLATSTRNF